MRNALVAITSLLLLGLGCGDDTPPPDDAAPDHDAAIDGAIADDAAPDAPETPLADAAPDAAEDAAPDASADAPPTDSGVIASCNPIAQTGCGPSEKCTQVLDGVGGHSIDCVPDGTLALGDACTAPVEGADECVGGGYCVGGTCKEICSTAPNSCVDGESCTIYAGTFDQIENTGLCAAGCDPVQQNCDGSNACYLQLSSGQGVCAGVPGPAMGLEQDETCYGPEAGVCYLNGCDAGFQGLLPSTVAGDPIDLCAAFCTPAPTHTGATANPGGISDGTVGSCADAGSPDHQCRYINSFYSGLDLVSDALGFCAPVAEWGDCTTFDLQNPVAIFGCVPFSQLP